MTLHGIDPVALRQVMAPCVATARHIVTEQDTEGFRIRYFPGKHILYFNTACLPLYVYIRKGIVTSWPGLQLIGKQMDCCDYVTGACRMRTAVQNRVDLRRSMANQEYYFNSLFCIEAKRMLEMPGRILNLRMRNPAPL
jgi:hypothetical protein